jgi:hypothetical protein
MLQRILSVFALKYTQAEKAILPSALAKEGNIPLELRRMNRQVLCNISKVVEAPVKTFSKHCYNL